MAKPAHEIPAKLKNDAIVEALVELRFDLPTGSLPELSFVRLAENSAWKDFQQRMLPLFHVPAAMRMTDVNLRYQPALELLAPDKGRTIRVGPQVLSYHRLAPYVGWDRFRPEIEETVRWVFTQMPEIIIQRLGVRYMNALRADVHRIKSVLDLNLELKVAGAQIDGNVNVNFTEPVTSDTACTVRIATPEFVQLNGPVLPDTSVYVDVDVFTKDNFSTTNRDAVVKWINDAHTAEKQHFFRLLRPETISELKER